MCNQISKIADISTSFKKTKTFNISKISDIARKKYILSKISKIADISILVSNKPKNIENIGYSQKKRYYKKYRN